MTVAGSDNHQVIERGGGIAVWRQLASRLRDDIAHGRLDQNRRLPTEFALAERFKVNRHTVRRAIATLADEGLVRVEQGRGVFAEDVVVDYPLRHRTRFSASLLKQGLEPGHDVMDVTVVPADRRLASKLGVQRGAEVVQSRATGLADGIPLNVSLSFFPKARFPGLALALEAEKSITKALAALDLTDYRRRETKIITRMPTEDEARALRQPACQPILVTEAIDVDPDGCPIRFGLSCFAGARVQITVDDGSM
ncbi:MAG: phosphonate metabolism transcriptional regulator PhnF [Geminicoccaceae bacterium]